MEIKCMDHDLVLRFIEKSCEKANGQAFDFINLMNDKREIVYHYTKIPILEKIFLPDKISLQLSKSTFTNDPSESLSLIKFLEVNKKIISQCLENGCREKFLESCKKKIEERNNEIIEIPNYLDGYVFSTTYLKDSFAFWNKKYAGKSGIAIGFYKEAIKEILSNKEPNDDLMDVIYIDPFYEIKDKKNVYLQHIVWLITKIYDDNESNSMINEYGLLEIVIQCLSIYFKHKSWDYEKESRIVQFKPPKDLKKDESQIKFTKKGITQISYSELDKDAIASIIFGPNCKEAQIQAVKDYLKENKYDVDKITFERSTAFDLQYR